MSGGSGSGSGTVVFNDPAHSTSDFTGTISVGLVAGIPTMNGSITLTGGAFTGAFALALPLTAEFNPALCSLPGGMPSATFANATTVAL